MTKQVKEEIKGLILDKLESLDNNLILDHGLVLTAIGMKLFDRIVSSKDLKQVYILDSRQWLATNLTDSILKELATRPFIYYGEDVATVRIPIRLHRPGQDKAVYTTYDAYLQKKNEKYRVGGEEIRFSLEGRSGLSVDVSITR